MANESTNTNENTNNQGTGNENANGSQNTQEQNKQLTTSELEAKIKQLEAENGKLRQANTNASADASKWKQKYNETLSEEAKKKADQDEQAANLQKELEALRAERNVANYKSQLTAPDIGFDTALAQEVAEAMNNGEIAKVFDGLRKFIVAHDKQLRETAFKGNPTLQGGNVPKAVTKEEFDKMGYMDRRRR